jgi:hypothetical protein
LECVVLSIILAFSPSTLANNYLFSLMFLNAPQVAALDGLLRHSVGAWPEMLPGAQVRSQTDVVEKEVTTAFVDDG